MAQNIPISENISEYIISTFGEDFFAKYQEYIHSDTNLYIRVSPLFNEPGELQSRLKKYGIELETVPNIPNALKVTKGSEFISKTIEYATGRYYIQSLSSMIPPLVLNPSSDDKVLDLCAAPGSKSSQIAELMNNKGTLYVNEPNLDRIKGLIFNLDKLNLVNVGAIKYKGELLSKFFENSFDKILADVPCSGLGILQKKGEVSNWWNLSIAEKIAELQFRLLVSAIKMLKVGGEMVYSTCTLTVEENELLLNKFLKKYPVEVLPIELPVKSTGAYTNIKSEVLHPELAKAHRIIPWEINSEGFFVTKLKKIDEASPAKMFPVTDNSTNFVSAKDKSINKYLKQIANYYGLSVDVLYQYKYMIRKSDVMFVHKDWETNSSNLFVRIGRKFCLINRRDEAQIQTYAIAQIAQHITKNIIELTDKEDIKKYFIGGTIKKKYESFGQKAIKINGRIVGTGVCHKDGLKSQYPRTLRTSEIIVPE